MIYQHPLFGDGIRDDTAAIQERIDSGIRELVLPMPPKHYLISRPLVLPSNFSLVLPRFGEIRLADGSDCLMLKSRTQPLHASRLPGEMEDIFRHILAYVDDFDPEFCTENISVTGGIWNCNNQGQSPNPMKSGDFSKRDFPGFGMLFYNVKNLKLSSLTLKDPLNYGAVLDRVTDFTVEDITFDYNKGNPLPITMDGIHLCGNCHRGSLRELKGACYDDMVAVNADDGSHGDISDIEIRGVYAENCHSAVRLLAVHHHVKNVRISRVEGTFFQYCVGLTHYFPGACDGGFSEIRLEDLQVSKAPRTREVYPYPQCEIYPVIWVESGVRVKDLTINKLRREEFVCPAPTLSIGDGASVESLCLQNVAIVNATGQEMPFLENRGFLGAYALENVTEESKNKTDPA